MAWRDNLQDASFRGVPFFVASHDASTGREIVVHKFPLRDAPFVEDLGRSPRTFSVEAYVIGPDYMAAREALLAALEEVGPGRLVHPYRGELICSVEAVSTRESTAEGGFCSFQISFIESDAQAPQAAGGDDPRGLVEDATQDLWDDAAESLEDVFSVLQQPQFAIDSLQGIVTGMADTVDKVLSPVVSGVQALARLRSSVYAIKADVTVLLRTPAKLASQIRSIFTGIRGAFSEPGLGVKALTRIASAAPPVALAPNTTAVRRQELVNQLALMRAFRAAAIAEAATAALDVPFQSYDDAVETRDAILTALDAEIEIAPDQVYPAMAALAAALVKAVPGSEKELARLAVFTPLVALPSVVLAYRLYGDLKDEADIVERNRLRHPLFVPGGKSVQVLGRV